MCYWSKLGRVWGATSSEIGRPKWRKTTMVWSSGPRTLRGRHFLLCLCTSCIVRKRGYNIREPKTIGINSSRNKVCLRFWRSVSIGMANQRPKVLPDCLTQAGRADSITLIWKRRSWDGLLTLSLELRLRFSRRTGARKIRSSTHLSRLPLLWRPKRTSRATCWPGWTTSRRAKMSLNRRSRYK